MESPEYWAEVVGILLDRRSFLLDFAHVCSLQRRLSDATVPGVCLTAKIAGICQPDRSPTADKLRGF